MAETWISWPELAACVGEDKARALCAVRGGVSFYVPRAGMVAVAGGWLSTCLGEDGLAALSAHFGGEYVTVPNHRRAEPFKDRAMALLEKGASCRRVALELGLTERYVRRLSRQCRLPGPRQMTLWERPERVPGVAAAPAVV